MNYQFPVIQHINDVLPAIAGCDDFIVAEKDGYTVINYRAQNADTFPPVIEVFDSSNPFPGQIAFTNRDIARFRRECRGLIFCNETGKVLSRGYHKFFNQNERPETTDIDLSQPHVILEKLDGSLLRPLFIGNAKRPRWITKMGITDVSMQVENWLAENPELQKKYEAAVLTEQGLGTHTLIFEWCSRKQRIVLDYPEDQLILTGKRDNKTGVYTSLAHLQWLGQEYDIPVVKTVPTANVGHVDGIEGVVIRFDDGHMVKVKTEWYVLRHKALDGLRAEKNILKLILDNGIDDVLPLLDDQMKEYLGGYAARVWQRITRIGTEYYDRIRIVLEDNPTWGRKEFAIWANSLEYPWLAFKIYGGKDAREEIKLHISKNLSSQTTVDNIRELIGVTWYA
jgi:RNA ligase